jgi:hypothetical protein
MIKLIICLQIIFILFIIVYTKFYEGYDNICKLSVLILSYNRPHNLKKSIPKLLEYNEVDEIIILHGNEKFKKEYHHPKVKNIDDWVDNNEIYTLRKFKNANICKNNMILLLDDDLYPSKELLEKMIEGYKRDNDNIYGPTKRLCNEKNYIWNPKTEYNFILTNLILTSKNVIKNVYKMMQTNKEFFDLVVNQRGNCEDLLFNHEFINLYNKKPVYTSGNYKSLDGSKGFSTTNNKEHENIRNNFCRKINL